MDKLDYDAAKADAGEMVSFYGDSGEFTRTEGGGIDPFTGAESTGVITTLSGTVSPVVFYKAREIDGTVIQQGDGYVFFHGPRLGIGDITSLNGQDYRVINIEKIESVSNTLVYQKVQVRR